MTARYATFGGLRVAGGVRVLIDVSAKQGYVQIISLLSEVFVTHYISTLTFLNSTSAAGVAWCAVIVEPTKLAEPANNVSCSQSVYDSGQDKCRDSAPEQQQQVSDVSRGKIDTAHVVFCDPYQAHRFRTVLETLKCAISDEGCLAVPCVPPPTTCPCTPCVPCTIVEPDLQAHLPYCNPCPVQCQRPAMSPGNCASLYSPSASLHQQPPAMYTGSCPPIPTNEPPGGIYPPNLTPGQAGQLSTSPGTPTAGMPYPNTPVYESSMGIDHSSAADLLTNPVDITGSNNLAPCDPPSAPMTPNSANAGNYAQSTSVCVPYDPYAYENCQGKILFNSNACLVKLGKDKSWVDMQKGTVKIVQCPSGMGYSIVLENVNKSLSIYHFIRPDTVFEPAPKTQYGFVYNTANFSDGCGNEEYFLLSFQCESHAEKFKAIVDYIHCVQMMSCGNDNCNNVRSISISQWEAGSSTSRDSNHRYSSSRLSHTRGARVS